MVECMLLFVPYVGIEPTSSPMPPGASFVSPQTCNLQLSVVATQLNLNVVSASGRLQHSHTATSQRVCITFFLVEQVYINLSRRQLRLFYFFKIFYSIIEYCVIIMSIFLFPIGYSLKKFFFCYTTFCML